LIPAEAAEAAEKAIPKKAHLPVLTHAQVFVEKNRGNIVIATTDLESPRVVTLKAADGQFPNTDQVMPKNKPVITITIGANQLAALVRYRQKFDAPIRRNIKFTFYAPDKAVKFEWKNFDHAVVGLIMPMRVPAYRSSQESTTGEGP
jgi:DNA polymerase III sliding clamp (beta) subunit (PCNA family)